jgi:hypothetical protein
MVTFKNDIEKILAVMPYTSGFAETEFSGNVITDF